MDEKVCQGATPPTPLPACLEAALIYCSVEEKGAGVVRAIYMGVYIAQ